MGENMKYTVKSIVPAKTQEEREFEFPNIPNQETREHVESVTRNNPGRLLGVGLANIAAGIGGRLGNIASLGGSAINWAQKQATGKDIPGHATFQNYAPTSENILKGLSKATGSNLEGGSVGKFIQNTASLGASGVGLGKAAKIAAGGQVARGIAKAADVGEVGQAIAEVSGGLAAQPLSNSLINIGKSFLKGEKVTSGVRHNLESAIKPALYAEADILLPKHSSGNARDIESFISKINPSRGGIKTGTKKIIKENLGPIEDAINKTNRTMSIKDAIKFKQDINDNIGTLLKDHTAPSGAVKLLKKTVNELNAFIEGSTEKKYPEFWDKWQKAENLHKGLAGSSRQSQGLARDILKGLGVGGASGVIGYLAKGAAGSIAGPVLAGAVKLSLDKVKPFSKLIYHSPVARKEYQKALGALATDNIPLAIKSFSEIQKLEEGESSPQTKTYTVKSFARPQETQNPQEVKAWDPRELR